MKCFAYILIWLSFLSFSSAEEEVYYCILKHDTFLESPNDKIIPIEKDRFVASIDFENEVFISDDIWKIKKDNLSCKFFEEYEELVCNGNNKVQFSFRKGTSYDLPLAISWLGINVFREDSDPVYAAYGECEIF